MVTVPDAFDEDLPLCFSVPCGIRPTLPLRSSEVLLSPHFHFTTTSVAFHFGSPRMSDISLSDFVERRHLITVPHSKLASKKIAYQPARLKKLHTPFENFERLYANF